MKIYGYVNDLNSSVSIKIKAKYIDFVLKIDKTYYVYDRRYGLITVSGEKKSRKKIKKFLKKKQLQLIAHAKVENERALHAIENYCIYTNMILTKRIGELEVLLTSKVNMILQNISQKHEQQQETPEEITVKKFYIK